MPPSRHSGCDAPIDLASLPSLSMQTCSHRPLQVRCDAASLGIPCTNCVAFSIECRIPQPKRKKPQSATGQSKDSDRCAQPHLHQEAHPMPQPVPWLTRIIANEERRTSDHRSRLARRHSRAVHDRPLFTTPTRGHQPRTQRSNRKRRTTTMPPSPTT
jgi:hypothetical protein